MKTRIYGASDDLIEIEGGVNEEVGCHDHKKPISISASDGTKATIYYDENGEWTIKVLKSGGGYRVVGAVGDNSTHSAEGTEGCPPYSDVLILEADVEWIKVGRKTFKANENA